MIAKKKFKSFDQCLCEIMEKLPNDEVFSCECGFQYWLAQKLKNYADKIIFEAVCEPKDNIPNVIAYDKRENKRDTIIRKNIIHDNENIKSKSTKIDLLVKLKNSNKIVPIELKYRKKLTKNLYNGIYSFELSNDSAINLTRYDYWKDVARLEYEIDWLKAKITENATEKNLECDFGYAIIITNQNDVYEKDGKEIDNISGNKEDIDKVYYNSLKSTNIT